MRWSSGAERPHQRSIYGRQVNDTVPRLLFIVGQGKQWPKEGDARLCLPWEPFRSTLAVSNSRGIAQGAPRNLARKQGSR